MLGRHAHAVHLDQQNVNTNEHGRDSRQNGDVKSEESCQCRTGDLIASAQKSEHRSADKWNDSGDLGADLGRKERQLVPRQQIAAETKADTNEQKEHARDPCDLARRCGTRS